MRVLHIGKYYPPCAGGMERFLADLLGALHEKGVSVAALVHNDSPGLHGVPPADCADFPIYRAPTYGRLLYVPLAPSFPAWMNRAIREFSPDILHLHLPNSSAFSALVLSSARRLPWVVHWHADFVASRIERRLALAYRLYRPLEQRLLGKSDAVVATSPPYLDQSEALRPWRSRSSTISLGLDEARLVDPPPRDLEEAESVWGSAPLRVLAIGRLTYYKGYEVLLRSIARLPEARLLIVGAGETYRRLSDLKDILRLGARVSLLGYRADPELWALLSTCDVVCLPSIERTEAFGLVLLEAMRFGKPVIATDIPGSGTGWVVRRAGHGLLVPPGDDGALADAMNLLKDDLEMRRRMGAKGAGALKSEFNIRSVAETVSDLYRSVLVGRESR